MDQQLHPSQPQTLEAMRTFARALNVQTRGKRTVADAGWSDEERDDAGDNEGARVGENGGYDEGVVYDDEGVYDDEDGFTTLEEDLAMARELFGTPVLAESIPEGHSTLNSGSGNQANITRVGPAEETASSRAPNQNQL